MPEADMTSAGSAQASEREKVVSLDNVGVAGQADPQKAPTDSSRSDSHCSIQWTQLALQLEDTEWRSDRDQTEQRDAHITCPHFASALHHPTPPYPRACFLCSLFLGWVGFFFFLPLRLFPLRAAGATQMQKEEQGGTQAGM
jgi:hypothetical protein